ncbi:MULTISPECIES: DUF6262 family protein [Vibrio]|uniref:DUF6262 family protein n=1 Tax=Vibrio TaxID=662 RepID=UPI0011DE7F77|nr:DUF6262 family protein [Vibrio anguillarum]TYC91487.1 hypothetical protein FXB64_10750 [Vibrio anguillarum]TYC95718.1 hypothetical protein FXB62_09695 [Vibrio anguillarum]
MSNERYITEHVKNKIIKIIDLMVARNEKVTWDKIAQAAGYTRAALSRDEEIKEAYQKAKKGSRILRTDAQKIADLTNEVSKLEDKVKKLNLLKKNYENKYIRWLYNASNSGVSEEILNRPLPDTMKTTKRKKGMN